MLDRNTGLMVNPNMEFYLLAGHADIPKIDVKLMNQPERGVIGIGEPPTISTAAAIANAVAQRDRRARCRACRSRPTRCWPRWPAREQEGRCESVCLRQRGEPEGGARGARDASAGKVAADWPAAWTCSG